MNSEKTRRLQAAAFAVLAAALYALNAPTSKILLGHAGATMTAGFLYLGAGVGLAVCAAVKKLAKTGKKEEKLTKKELPYTLAMIILDIAAPILLMLGLGYTGAASVSLLGNFEIVATSLVALVFFGEKISPRLWCAIWLITAASILLGFESGDSLGFGVGALFVLGACVCWGFENNCTRKLSCKSPTEIVMLKGCFSGLGSIIIALIVGEKFPEIVWILAIMALGFVSYGLSIWFYIRAQKTLGAARTSAYYAVAPFIGVGLGILFGDRPGAKFFVALAVMVAATVIMVRETMTSEN